MTHTDALPATTHRGEELRYVTEHFHDLQGLYFAWFWAGLLFLCFLSSSTHLSRGHVLIVAVSIIALFLPVGVPCIHAWYKRYGMVQNRAPEISEAKPLSILDTKPAPRRTPVLFWAWLGIWGVFVGTGLFRGLDAHRSALNLWISLWLTLPRCFYPAPANGFIQLRRALYIAGSAAIFFAILGVPFVPLLHSSKWLLLEIVCTTLLVLSLYDHWLLNHLLSARPEVSYD
ncbi:MAG: hypothetical protein WAK33_15705 [Silvibacterium sp.]